MEYSIIRNATNEDKQLIIAYFKKVLNHFQEQAMLKDMQDIKYFLHNMDVMKFFVVEESTLQITFLFEFPEMDGQEKVSSLLTIPYQN